MPNYEEIYFKIFNMMTKVIEIMQEAQSSIQEEYINDNSSYKRNMLTEYNEKYKDN